MPSDLEILSPACENTNEKPIDASKSSAETSTKKRKSDAAVADTPKGENDPAPKPKKARKNAAASSSPEGQDLFSISLPGDEDGTVEIYDSCNEVRRKINAHLRSPITKAQFLRDIVRAAYPGSYDSIKIQSKQLSDFLTKKGPTAGSTSRVFYAAYVYFEKKRLSEGKGKSKHRLEMEAQWGGQGGMPREREQSYLCGPGMIIVQDELGKIGTAYVGMGY
ncbi:hypothetical protein E1B28_000390 [Marasmius oreades]|uniref:DUF7726 domain-containing protein n=1 Tax=Marasmius oreades TaxID=181124 RepID=A0A9P7V175_9AGAR|nr:uncharacterized protein E1B28_000390 [Marasmius oreades]KAG7098439.1 hypothetical protein E1B28_000390 [Marasmius oreades]